MCEAGGHLARLPPQGHTAGQAVESVVKTRRHLIRDVTVRCKESEGGAPSSEM